MIFSDGWDVRQATGDEILAAIWITTRITAVFKRLFYKCGTAAIQRNLLITEEVVNEFVRIFWGVGCPTSTERWDIQLVTLHERWDVQLATNHCILAQIWIANRIQELSTEFFPLRSSGNMQDQLHWQRFAIFQLFIVCYFNNVLLNTKLSKSVKICRSCCKKTLLPRFNGQYCMCYAQNKQDIMPQIRA